MGAYGINRNLTPVFIKYRNDHKFKKNRFGGIGLLGNNNLSSPDNSVQKRLLNDDNGGERNQLMEADSAIEMAELPPTWVDTSDEAKTLIAKLKERVDILRKAHQKRLRQVFKDDESRGDQEIQQLSGQISNLFRECEGKIREIQTKGSELGITNKDYGLRQNVQRSLATQIQQLSQQFRKYQKSYMEELQKRDKGTWNDNDLDLEHQPPPSGLSPEELLAYEEQVNVHQRSEEITKIAKSINELHTVFKEMSVLVIDQGTILDRIDYNVEQVVHHTVEANVQLVKAREKARSNRAGKCIMILAVLNTILLILNFIKFYNAWFK